jgi:hypothetical protein
MKARVNATGEIVEVKVHDKYFDCNGHQWIIYEDKKGRTFNEKHLEFNLDNSPLDYWEKLLHQYAGMAMQELVHLVNVGYEYVYEETAIIAMNFAHALVEKMKENEKAMH